MKIYTGAISAERKLRSYGETVSKTAMFAIVAESEEEAVAAMKAEAIRKYPPDEWNLHDMIIAVLPECVILDSGYTRTDEKTAFMERLDEAYYAMVAGNAIQEAVPYRTVREWLRYVLYGSVEKEKQSE